LIGFGVNIVEMSKFIVILNMILFENIEFGKYCKIYKVVVNYFGVTL